jgi:hypothetical protein
MNGFFTMSNLNIFSMPPYGEGSGAYVDAIQAGLKVWDEFDPQTPYCPQEYDILLEIKDIIEQWHKWDTHCNDVRPL